MPAKSEVIPHPTSGCKHWRRLEVEEEDERTLEEEEEAARGLSPEEEKVRPCTTRRRGLPHIKGTW